MCGIIGAFLQKPNNVDFSGIKRVFVESKIRGKHATGISYLKSNKIETIKESIPSDEFVEKYLHNMENFLNEDGNLYLIGHCRYSTSDLRFNQPLYNENKSIVHNGVITQELPENWESLYGHKTKTMNDSELVLFSKDPLTEFNHMSMGVCELSLNKTLRFYRNGKRPVYLSRISNGFIVTSTENIAFRSGLSDTKMIDVNCYYGIDNFEITECKVVCDYEDLQR